MTQLYDLVIVGAGPGGYTAALQAADFGMKVALSRKRKLEASVSTAAVSLQRPFFMHRIFFP